MSRAGGCAQLLEPARLTDRGCCHSEVPCCPLGVTLDVAGASIRARTAKTEPLDCASAAAKQLAARQAPWLWLPADILNSAPVATTAGQQQQQQQQQRQQQPQQPAKRRKTCSSSAQIDAGRSAVCLPPSSSACAASAAAANPSLTTDPLAAEDLLLSWYSLYQPRPNPAAAAAAATAPAGSMLAAMSTLMMPAMTLAGHHNLHHAHAHPAAAALAGALGQHGQPHAHHPAAGHHAVSAPHHHHHHAHHHHHGAGGQPKPADLLGLVAGHPAAGLPIAHLTLKAASVNGHGSGSGSGASLGAGSNGAGSSGGGAGSNGASGAGGGSSSAGPNGAGSGSNGSAAGGAGGGGGANGSGNGSGSGSSAEHFHIFVGDLSPEIETQTLRDAFAAFGEISDCRVVRDPQTLKSKGYGFVSYVKKSDAESAIAGMNGQWLGTRAIRTNWATRKPPAPKDAGSKPLSYEEVFGQSSSTNCTVYCGNLAQGTTEEALQKIFGPYGQIQEIRVFKDKGYAFIRFASKESATQAIVSVHNTDLNGQNVKCSWGKEPGEPGGANNAQLMAGGLGPANAQYPYGYNQSMGYWYPGSYPPQMPSQFAVQGMQGYAYGQYGFQPGMGMQLPGGWQSVPAQGGAGAAMSGQQMAAAAAAAAAAVSQQGGMVASYPIQQFQAQ